MSPPPVTVSPERVLTAATTIVRKKGLPALSCRAVADELGCSVAPIYRIYASMDALTEATLTHIFSHLVAYMTKPYVPSALRSAGIGIVLFARDEPNFYRALFLERHGVAKMVLDLLGRLEAAAATTPGIGDVTAERRSVLVLDLWLYTHGLASMASASLVANLDEAWVAEKLQRVGAVLIGATLATAEVRPMALVDPSPRKARRRPK
ncbi:MAG: TetR/AcrR family transcriptional regulator [Myxococcales bacterium]|nr:TetR/AcrR family transcriptional regulator [Myxococcales bacterium]MBL9109896.1 TetR/AcrR family transcriptional regulator [Myxococcales bacterium]